MKPRIDLGKVGEYAFATELLKRGYVPLWPSTETVPYDLGFWNGRHFIRVQVKATAQEKDIHLRVHTELNGKDMPYTKAHADVLALWLTKLNLWYIIPIEMVKKNMGIAPASKRCRWAKFKEAWDNLA